MTGLTMLTFGHLTNAIDEKLARARGADSRMHWERLKDVVEDVAGAPTADDLDPAASGRTWWLTSIQVSGFRGIPDGGVTLDLPAGPGLTVIHGANGAGKSSLAGAIDVGLHTSGNASIARRSGTGGRAPVWEPVLVNAVAGVGRIVLAIQSSVLDRLTIECTVKEDEVTDVRATMRSQAGDQTTLTLGAAWQSALHAYGPVYSYSAWEQYIQASKDLQEYLSRMLVLGGCFGAVQTAVDTGAEEATQAAKLVGQALAASAKEVATVEEVYGRPLSVPLPDEMVDVDLWWQQQDLPEPTPSQTTVASTIDLEEFWALVETAHGAQGGLNQASAQRHAELASALKKLRDVPVEAVAADECPVCGSHTDWQAHLEGLVAKDQLIVERVEAWYGALTRLKEQCRLVLGGLMAAADDNRSGSLRRARELLDTLEAASPYNQGLESEAARTGATELMGVLRSDEFRSQAVEAGERASEEAAWRLAVARALAPLRDALREHGTTAADRAAWVGVQDKLRSLEGSLKKERQESLQAATDETLQDLLRDAGISVTGLDVLRTKADIRLEDAQGLPLELGMLSAGQRNALLLAPALVVAEESPFGFFVMDDPVHAFDELRVDYVARQLMSVAKRRRLVVFTHDERLREHLLSAPMDVDCRSIHRVPGTGDVELTPSSPLWEMLLDDAQALLQLNRAPDVVKGLTTGLRGICRQAVDNALRLLVTKEAIKAGADSASWIQAIDADKVGTTGARLSAAKKLLVATSATTHSLDEASRVLSPYMEWWNKASHGNDPLPGSERFTQDELDAARAACTEIVG